MKQDDLALGRAHAARDVLCVRRGRAGLEVQASPRGFHRGLALFRDTRRVVRAGALRGRRALRGVTRLLQVAHVHLRVRRGDDARAQVVQLARAGARSPVAPRRRRRRIRVTPLQPRDGRARVRGGRHRGKHREGHHAACRARSRHRALSPSPFGSVRGAMHPREGCFQEQRVAVTSKSRRRRIAPRSRYQHRDIDFSLQAFCARLPAIGHSRARDHAPHLRQRALVPVRAGGQAAHRRCRCRLGVQGASPRSHAARPRVSGPPAKRRFSRVTLASAHARCRSELTFPPPRTRSARSSPPPSPARRTNTRSMSTRYVRFPSSRARRASRASRPPLSDRSRVTSVRPPREALRRRVD